MQYMCLIYSEPAPAGTPPPSPEELQPWIDYDAALKEAGVFVGGEALHGPETATTVHVRDGEAITTDGPFAETKEVLGGYYVIDVPDLDAALEWSAKNPGAHYGRVEVRPVMTFEAMS